VENQAYVLEMNNITKQFPGVVALNTVTLKVRPGTVHSLMGENGAGKSTLMKCLFGIYEKDDGQIIHNNREVNFHSSMDAISAGIAMIHQELQPEPHLTVMENLWLGRLPKKGFLVDYKKMYQDSMVILNQLSFNCDPKTLVKTLSVSQIQSIEIAKAISRNANVIIMDEPTSSLTETETEFLFKIIDDLRRKGIVVIYISHKMDEILRISDEVSIMRDGNMIGTWKASDLTRDMIIAKMVGRDIEDYFPKKKNIPGHIILEVHNFSSIHEKSFQNISFNLRKGEIFGIAGLVGAQRTELVEGIFGIRSTISGELIKDGRKIVVRHPNDAIRNKIALLTEDRKGRGIFPVLGVDENIYISMYKDTVNAIGKISYRKCKNFAQKGIDNLNIKTPTFKTPINNLSGGNQQKALLARCLLKEPDILILDEPTRGIDVGAKHDIYTIINDLASAGKSIIVISSEMPELIGLADRIMVMCEGRKTGELGLHEFTEESIMRLATNFV
jgi:methyl-galactoside transport system ATP-binding protein